MPGKIHVPIAVNIEGIQKVTSALGKLSTSVGAAVGAFGALTARTTLNFAQGAIAGAADLERNLAGLETVFGTTTQQMVDFASNATGMGLSLSEAAKASTFIGSVLKQSGFSIQETADLTEDLVTLGADLALTYGYDVQEALLGMTALFRGEYDPIEKFGVAMKQSEIDAEKAARGLDGLTGAAERFADQQIRVEFLMERAGDAMGQVERQQNSLAVQQNRLNATFNTMRDIVGMELAPVMAELTGGLADMVTRLMPKVTETFAAFEEPLRRIGNDLIPVIEGLLTEFLNFLSDLAAIFEQATDPTSDLGDSLQNVGLLIDYLFGEFEKFGLEVPDFITVVTDTVGMLADGIFNVVTGIQDAFWFVEAFITALGKFDIWAMIWGDEAERRRFSDYIGNQMWLNQRNRDTIIETGNAIEDNAFKQEQFNQKQKEYGEALLAGQRAYEAELKAIAKEEERLAALADKVDLNPAASLASADVKDPVGDFFARLEDEINKQAARIELEEFGLSAALIDQVLGSGEDWTIVYNAIISGGKEAAQTLQEQFNKTATGLEELAAAQEAYNQKLEELNQIAEERQATVDQYNADVADATETFMDFVMATREVITGIDPLETYQRAIGQFEQQTRRDLDSIERQINQAFDNGYLLESARDNLLAYAREELNILIGIQRQRDELLAQRNAAADTIFGIAQAVAATGNLTSLLGDVQDKVTEIQVTEVFEDIVKTAGSLEGFKVTLTRNFIDVVTETVSASNQLTSNFQAVIDRTAAFISNLELLREMGLDPFLFNQLVEAGAEAGGATAQALVEGGADTIAEVNRLQGVLESMGVDLGEMTYEVTKDSGEQFVSGIIDGMDSKLEDLQQTAADMAIAFSTTFADAMQQAMDTAFQSILETIKAEFQALMDELARQEAIARGYTSPETKLTAGGTHATTAVFDPVTGELLRSYTAPIDSPLIQDGMVNPDYFEPYPAYGMMSANATVTNEYNLTVNTNGNGSSTGAEVINALKTWNATNGDYTVSLTGFGA